MARTRLWVFDVERGFCAFVLAPSRATLMIDCGRSDQFSPALYVRQRELSITEQQVSHPLTKLVVTHPHDDHIEDIAGVIKYLPPKILLRHQYNWNEVESQSGGDYQNLREWARFQAGYTAPPEPVDWGGLNITYWGLSVEDAKVLNESKFINNSSIITIIEFGGYKVVFPGDVETDGWRRLLQWNNDFCAALSGANVFVTSHHGHSSGYAPEIFNFMGRPDFILSSIHHGDESVEAAYSSPDCAKGLTWNGRTRHHFTTRTDGSLHLEIDETGRGFANFIGLA